VNFLKVNVDFPEENRLSSGGSGLHHLGKWLNPKALTATGKGGDFCRPLHDEVLHYHLLL
jgi:hypothetical protein